METLRKITAKDNPAVKLYRKLSRSRKERMRERKFVLEGFRLVTDAVKSGAHLTHIFWTTDGYSRWEAEHVQVDWKETSCALLSNELGTEFAQTEHSQGVYAICKMPEQPYLEELIHPGGNYAILHQLQDPGNAGMILRTADALGIDGVIYSACCDIYSPKVVRATMGSLFRVPLCTVTEIAPVLEVCREASIQTCAAVVGGDAQHVGRFVFHKGMAVVIGNEGNGLPSEVASACTSRITIPMHGTIESLNAAMAAGIILWEMQRGKEGK